MVFAQMTYKIIIHPEAAKEIATLDRSYQIIEERILVQIIAVGKREGMQVYQKAAKRIS